MSLLDTPITIANPPLLPEGGLTEDELLALSAKSVNGELTVEELTKVVSFIRSRRDSSLQAKLDKEVKKVEKSAKKEKEPAKKATKAEKTKSLLDSVLGI